MLVFHVILYIPISQNIKGPKEKEGERERAKYVEWEISVMKSMRLAMVLGTYDLSFSTTLSKLDIVFQWHLRFLKGMFEKDIEFELLYVLLCLFGILLGST